MFSWYRIQAAALAAVVCLALAAAVMLRRKLAISPRSFAFVAINLAAFFIADALELSELLPLSVSLPLKAFFVTLLPASLVGFFATFAGHRDRHTIVATLLARLLSGVGAVSAVALILSTNAWESESSHYEALLQLLHLSFGGLVIALALSLMLMIRQIRRVELQTERARYIALTAITGSTYALALIAYAFDVGIAWLGNMLVALTLFFIYQVLTLRRVLDAYEFVGRVLVLGGMGILISTIYALLVGWWRHDFGLFLFNSIIAAVVILILLEPLRLYIETRLNEWIFRERFEFTRDADAMIHALANVIDIGGMTDLIMSRLAASRQITHSSLYLRDEEGLQMNRLGFVGAAPPEAIDTTKSRHLMARLLQHKVLNVDRLERELEMLEHTQADLEAADPDTQAPLSQDLADEGQRLTEIESLQASLELMRALEAQLLVAFTGSSNEAPNPLELGASSLELLGFLAVKNERLPEAWSHDETRALVALASQATIIIENSRLFDRIRERDRLAATGQMAAGLAHEIRNPLGAIKGSAQLLAEVDDDQRPTFLKIIQEEVNRLDSVVSQFLTYARPFKGRHDIVDINRLLERTLALIATEAPEAAIDFIPAPNLPTITSDPEMIRQVALNLVRNALEAMAPQGGGTLTIATSLSWHPGQRPSDDSPAVQPGSYVKIRFEDTGPGIPPEIMERLFIPFFTTKDQGTGLGLAICRRIVESLGGIMEVSSRLQHGATFTLFLPTDSAQPPDTTTS